MEEFEVIIDLMVRTVVIFGAPYLIGALIGYSLRSIFSGGKSNSALEAAAVGAVAGAGAAALVETPKETVEPEKTEKESSAETTAAIEEVSDKEEPAKAEVSEETQVIEEVAQEEVKAEVEQPAETIAAVEEQPAAAKETVEEVVETAESVVEQVEAIARPTEQEENIVEEPAQVEEVAEGVETPAKEEVIEAEPENTEPEVVEAVAEIGDAESPIGDVEAVAKIDPNSIVPAAAGNTSSSKEEVSPKVPDLGPLADLPPSGESVLEQVEAIARPEGKPEKAEEVEAVQAQEAVEETVEEVVETVEVAQAEIAVPEAADIAQAVEVEEVVAPITTAQATEQLSVEADDAQAANGQSKDTLLSTSNKGRVIGSDIPDDTDLDIADLSDSEYARLSKDLPVNKATVMPSRSSQTDDLKQIKGIGVIAETQLNGIGVKSIHQIADWSEADIDAVDAKLNAGGRVRSERWVEQARFLTDKKIK